MAQWQIMKSALPVADDPLFDDGHPDIPGEPSFSTADVAAHVQGLGGDADGFNYVGPSPQ